MAESVKQISAMSAWCRFLLGGNAPLKIRDVTFETLDPGPQLTNFHFGGDVGSSKRRLGEAKIHCVTVNGNLVRRKSAHRSQKSSPCRLRQCKYLNNIVEQDHRNVKRRTWLAKGYGSLQTAWRTLRGIEAMEMVRKGRARWVATDDLLGQVKFGSKLFGIAA